MTFEGAEIPVRFDGEILVVGSEGWFMRNPAGIVRSSVSRGDIFFIGAGLGANAVAAILDRGVAVYHHEVSFKLKLVIERTGGRLTTLLARLRGVLVAAFSDVSYGLVIEAGVTLD
jgi:hypothetical protein